MSANGEVAQKVSILGALALYLDFINLFLLLLRIFGQRKWFITALTLPGFQRDTPDLIMGIILTTRECILARLRGHKHHITGHNPCNFYGEGLASIEGSLHQ